MQQHTKSKTHFKVFATPYPKFAKKNIKNINLYLSATLTKILKFQNYLAINEP
jgi:hypothetical protein